MGMELSEKEARRRIGAIESCLKKGFKPVGEALRRGEVSAIGAAAEMLGIPRQTLQQSISPIARIFALTPDWKLWNPVNPPDNKITRVAQADPRVVGQPLGGAPRDREAVELRDEITRLRASLKESHRDSSAGLHLREEVFKLGESMPEPRKFEAPPIAKRQHAETIIVTANDWQWGEVVGLDRMDGLNSYNVTIARKRALRMFQAVVALATVHWTGPPPARIILIIGGDMISGEIHEELAKTNELLSMPALKDCAGTLMGGIDLLERELECPIDIITIPGNHGRTTRKPESKLYASTSYDTLLGDILELHYRGHDRISFWAPASGDALFSVDGWRFLVTHGDRMGSRGGTGTMGPAATVARGFKRLVSDFAGRKIIFDHIICFHFHIALRLEEGWVSSTLVGPSEYARDTRFRPQPASQLLMTVHPKRGVTNVRELQVGAPDEGTIYRGPEDSANVRPGFNLPTIPRKNW